MKTKKTSPHIICKRNYQLKLSTNYSSVTLRAYLRGFVVIEKDDASQRWLFEGGRQEEGNLIDDIAGPSARIALATLVVRITVYSSDNTSSWSFPER